MKLLVYKYTVKYIRLYLSIYKGSRYTLLPNNLSSSIFIRDNAYNASLQKDLLGGYSENNPGG